MIIPGKEQRDIKKNKDHKNKIIIRGGKEYEKVLISAWNCRRINKSNEELAIEKINFIKKHLEKYKVHYFWLIDSEVFPDFDNYIKVNWEACVLYIRNDLNDELVKKNYAIESSILRVSFTYIKPFVNEATKKQIKLIKDKGWNIIGDLNEGTHKIFKEMYGIREKNKQTAFIMRMDLYELIEIADAPSDHQLLTVSCMINKERVIKEKPMKICNLSEKDIITKCQEDKVEEIRREIKEIEWNWRKHRNLKDKEDFRTIINASSRNFYNNFKYLWRHSKKETYLGQKTIENMKKSLMELCKVEEELITVDRIGIEQLNLTEKEVTWKGSYSKARDVNGMNFGELVKEMKAQKINEKEAMKIAMQLKKLGNNMKPFFLKKGNKTFINDINDTRLLLIVPVYVRIIEDILAERVIDTIERTLNLNDEYQNGFIRGKSTYDVVEKVKEWMNNDKWRYILSIDFRRAFDLIRIDKLSREIRKDENLKVEEKNTLIFIIQIYQDLGIVLSDGTIISKMKGVPMGARIAPLLFDLYLHYATYELRKSNIKITYYADNGYWCISKENEEQAIRLINNLTEEWNMEVNVKKTEYIANGFLLDDRLMQIGFKRVKRIDILGRLISEEDRTFDKKEIIEICTNLKIKAARIPLRALARIIITGTMAKLRYKLCCGADWLNYGEKVLKSAFALYKKQIKDFTWLDFIIINKNFTIMLLDKETYKEVYSSFVTKKQETSWPINEKTNKYIKECWIVDKEYDNIKWTEPKDLNPRNRMDMAKKIYEIIRGKAIKIKSEKTNNMINWEYIYSEGWLLNTFILDAINYEILGKKKTEIMDICWLIARTVTDINPRTDLLENEEWIEQEVMTMKKVNYTDMIEDTIEMTKCGTGKYGKQRRKNLSKWFICIDTIYNKRKELQWPKGRIIKEVVELHKDLEEDMKEWEGFDADWTEDQSEQYDEDFEESDILFN